MWLQSSFLRALLGSPRRNPLPPGENIWIDFDDRIAGFGIVPHFIATITVPLDGFTNHPKASSNELPHRMRLAGRST